MGPVQVWGYLIWGEEGAEFSPLPPFHPRGERNLLFLVELERTLFGLGIFTLHSLPPKGCQIPVPDSDVLSSQAPTSTLHSGRENNKLLLGPICMFACALSHLPYQTASATAGDAQADGATRAVQGVEKECLSPGA